VQFRIAMPMDQSRITGFGSDGATKKAWKCPKGHMLQPWTAAPGTCDGCKAQIYKGDSVMDCRQCNYYLCEACHPQEKEASDWFWGSLTYFADATVQEFNDISTEFTEMAGDLNAMVGELNPLSVCSAPQIEKSIDIDLSVPSKQSKKQGSKQKQRAEVEANSEEVGGAGQYDPAPTSGRRVPVKGILNPAAWPQSTPRDGKRKQQRAEAKAKAKAEDTEAQESTQQQEVTAEPAATTAAKPMEDLMDVGQHDLLDLDFEPAPATKVPEATSTLPAPMPTPAPPAATATSATSDFPDLLFDLGNPAPAVAATSPVAAAPAASFLDGPLLDFDGPPAAVEAPARTGGGALFGLAPPPAPTASLMH